MNKLKKLSLLFIIKSYLQKFSHLYFVKVKNVYKQNGNIIPVDFTTDGLVPGALSNPLPYKCCESF